METNDERWRRKLTDLEREHGLDRLAEVADMNPAYITQIIKGTKLPAKKDGSRSERSLGDTAARSIERGLSLERGWLDSDEDAVDMTAKELQLLGYFRELDESLQAIMLEQVRNAAEQQAKLREQFKKATAPRQQKAPTGQK